jgi:diaminohydroxyphosphoribosylaminopyrimidine deaminase/5-amino-6-(5-phosphoribosylamino)uracil reductase
MAVRQPVRVVVDRRLRTPSSARMLSLPGQTLIACIEQDPSRAGALEAAGARIYVCPESAGRVDLESLLRYLAREELNEVLVEAGPTLAGAMLQAGLVDELILYLAPHLMGDAGRGLFRLPGLDRMEDRIALQVKDLRVVGPDLRVTAVPQLTP